MWEPAEMCQPYWAYPALVLICPLVSSRLLFEDNDSGLFSVTLFRKAIDDFKHKARENKYIIQFHFFPEEYKKRVWCVKLASGSIELGFSCGLCFFFFFLNPFR